MKRNSYLKVASIVVIATFSMALSAKGQEQQQAKPATMYVVNGEEIGDADLQVLTKSNRIKEMRKGVSDIEKAALVKRYGARVNESYIAVLTLYSDSELAEKAKISPKGAEALRQAALAQQEKREAESTFIHVGDVAPNFTVEMLDGTKVTLSDLRGKVVLLNFWATWCGPCMMEFNEITDKILKRFEGKDFVLLAISRGEKREVVMEKMKNLKGKGIDFPVGIDPQKEFFMQYAKEFIPRNFVIDREGKVAYSTVGYSDTKLDDVAKKLEELLK